MTKEKLISDIELRLTKGKPSDDLELERSQIGHWLDITRDEFVKLSLDTDIRKGNPMDTQYIEKETCLAAVMESESCILDCKQKAVITLSKYPMMLEKDKGVVKVVTSEYQLVHKLDLESLEMINDMPFTKPSPNNLVYYREGNKIYVEGMNTNNIDLIKFIVLYVPQYTKSTISESDEFVVSGDLLGPLLDEVETIGRRQLYSSLEDDDNDGDQNMEING